MADTPNICANPRCRKLIPKDSLWLGYCNDECAYGHKEIDDDKQGKQGEVK